VGRSGKVIALDLLEMPALHGVTFLNGDFQAQATVAALSSALVGRAADLVLSDMAPNISGIDMSDQARAMQLAELALEFAVNHLIPGGNFLVKVFQGAGFEGFLKEMRSHFRRVVTRKPEASRGRSNEIYLLGMDLKAGLGSRTSSSVRAA
jgi:23S rRNA (uridine2552-2'-O)-methyltransferase